MSDPTARPSIGRWQERRLRRASPGDVAVIASLVALASAVVVAGRQASLALRPRSAVELSELLGELELPTRLPNAPLLDGSGNRVSLFDQIHGPRAAVAFYAPWCAPCQEELPKLVKGLGSHAEVLVMVSGDEDLDATRRALANLELSQLRLFVDASGQIQREGRVKGLPTTFLVTPTGAVLARAVGYSVMQLYRLTSRAVPGAEGPGAEEPE